MAKNVAIHYTSGALGQRILLALGLEGSGDALIDRDVLTPIDEFHLRGRQATVEMAQLAGLCRDLRVLDLGSGLGGASRYIAAEYGCRVVGIDLTREYVEVAGMLAARTGLADRVEYVCGDAANLPLPDASFDVVWTQHMTMNIADKRALFREIRRVLAPGGRLATYEIVAAGGGPILYPVPWARHPAISFVVTAPQMLQLLAEAGFTVEVWSDIVGQAPRLERIMASDPQAPPPLGFHLFFGTQAREMAGNLLRCVRERRVAVVQAVLRTVS